MDEKRSKNREFADLTRLSSVGIGLIVSIVIGWFFGSMIDKHFHTAPVFLLIFVLFGIGAGMLNVFRTIGKFDDQRGDRSADRRD